MSSDEDNLLSETIIPAAPGCFYYTIDRSEAPHILTPGDAIVAWLVRLTVFPPTGRRHTETYPVGIRGLVVSDDLAIELPGGQVDCGDYGQFASLHDAEVALLKVFGGKAGQ